MAKAKEKLDQEPGTLLHRIANELRNSIADAEYMKPEKWDDAAHETMWHEGIRAKRALLDEYGKGKAPEYTWAQLETGACAWEYVVYALRKHRDTVNPWEEYREAYGIVPLRCAVIRHAPELFAAYEAALKNGYEKDFDRDFIPKYMEDHVTRVLT